MHLRRPAYPSKRPAPHTFAGSKPAQRTTGTLTDNVEWTRELQPPELYRIQYQDRDGEVSTREISLRKIGSMSGALYLGVFEGGKFKTMKAERVLAVEQISQGHAASIRPFPDYATRLPVFPVAGAVHRMPTVAGNRTWKVDLNAYTCACPEKRIRLEAGYEPGQLGFVCPHMASAILDHLPAASRSGEWSPELLSFLASPTKIHINSLV